MVDVITDILTDLSRNDVVALFTQSSPIPHATDITLCAYMYALMNNNYMKPLEVSLSFFKIKNLNIYYY